MLLALFLIADLRFGNGIRRGRFASEDAALEGDTLERVVLVGAIVGLVIVILAMRGVLRILFLIWSFLVFVLLVKGYIFSGTSSSRTSSGRRLPDCGRVSRALRGMVSTAADASSQEVLKADSTFRKRTLSLT